MAPDAVRARPPSIIKDKDAGTVVEAFDVLSDLSGEPRTDDVSHATLTAEEERRVWQKIDMRLIPISTALYLVSYVDRGNIGNAKLQGLVTQLDMTGNRYNIALVRNVNVIVLLLKKCRPSRWIPGLALAWGIVEMAMGLVKTYPQFIGARICLGVTEAGLSPGIYYLLSLWYPRHMLSWRFGLFSSGATFAGAFSGLLAYGISFMSGTAGLLGWSWIFIIEGLLTIAVSIVAFITFVDLPETASFLTPKEREYVIDRLKDDNCSVGEEGSFRWRQIPEAVFDWKIVSGAFIDLSNAAPGYGVGLFLPFGYSAAISQLLSVPPYAIATAISIIGSHYSDRIRMRSPFIIAGLCVAFVGFGINISDASIGVKYFGLYLAVVGTFAGTPLIIAWMGNNAVGHYKRGVGIAMQLMFGNIAGIISSNVYRTEDAPRYIHGHIAEMGMLSMGLIVVPITAVIYARMNARRDAAQHEVEENSPSAPYTDEELKRMGDRAPGFRYTL
ncbi:MFS general substrate transporter [Cubamyces sp. BRFM 1775]|nr:MFS general substrate transporter [Cubamyces sp. BRFM 1775]